MAAIFEHGYALVVGIDDNKISRLALPTVAKDVQAVYDVLVHPERCAYQEDNVKLLSGADSTKNNILEAFMWLKEKVKADADATAVIYYSGHGYRDTATEEYYLIPYDFQSVARVRIDALQAELVAAEIAEIKSPRVLVILDCCHAEGMQVKNLDFADGPELKSVAFPEDASLTKNLPAYQEGSKDVSELSEGNGRAVLNSSTGSESSYVRSDKKMSVFTYHLIEALTGHAPHNEDDTTVVVTDVMSWVYRRVKETAAAMRVSQTPVMHTSNVFPVAQLIGGEGVAKGVDGRPAPPDPLAPLPGAAINVEGDNALVATGDHATINQAEGATVSGSVNTGGGDFAGRDVHKGDNVQGNKYGGDHVEGDKFSGDKVMGNKVEGDNINVGNISGSGIAIGRGAQATVSTTNYGSGSGVDFGQLFAPLQTIVAQNAPAQVGDVNTLKAEVQRGSGADDEVVGDLIYSIATAVPAAKPILQQIFANPAAAEAVGGITKVTLKRL